ncbi:hypothetical protein [Micromonospora viridifaciens]|uniref:hypothetical protein n=1 Tax=Micromonospora viridifaciens TaxID=1881 RepID=UPI000B5AC580|nr:hypothetical protein [Micromonospora viridifaciens]
MGRVPRFAAALALSLLVPIAPAGCSRFLGCAPRPPEDITESDLAGVYTSLEGGRIELGEDGRYSASNLPGAREEGTWTLDLDSKSTEDLRLEDLQLWISGNREEPWLYRFEGDPDRCDLIEFHRAR